MNLGLKVFCCKIVIFCFVIRVRGLICYGCDLLNLFIFLIFIRELVCDVLVVIYLIYYEVFKLFKLNVYVMFFF